MTDQEIIRKHQIGIFGDMKWEQIYNAMSDKVDAFLPGFLNYADDQDLEYYGGKWWHRRMKIEEGYTTEALLKLYRDHLKYQ